jgi:hypothetical protein
MKVVDPSIVIMAGDHAFDHEARIKTIIDVHLGGRLQRRECRARVDRAFALRTIIRQTRTVPFGSF